MTVFQKGEDLVITGSNQEEFTSKEIKGTAHFSLDLRGKMINACSVMKDLFNFSAGEIENFNLFSLLNKTENSVDLDGSITKRKEFYINAVELPYRVNFSRLKITLMPFDCEGVRMGYYGTLTPLATRISSEKILVEKKKFLEVNASYISSLMDNNILEVAVNDAFARIGETIEIDRMYYFEICVDEGTGEEFMRQKIEWTSGIVSTQIENFELQDLPVAPFKDVIAELRRKKRFSANLSALPDGDVRDLLLSQEIKAMLLQPIFQNNNLHGFFGFDDCTRERQWTPDEVSILSNLARNLGVSLEKRSNEKIIEQQGHQLVQSEKKFKALVQNGSDLIGVLDREGIYTFISETSKTILGFSPEEISGKCVLDFIHKDDREQVTTVFKELKDSRQVKFNPFRFRNSKGEWRWLEGTAINLLEDPAVRGVVTNSYDITESRRMLIEIQRQNEILKEISWQQSHVVRAPLARLLGLLDLLENGEYKKEEQEVILKYIANSLNELDQIIRSITSKAEKVSNPVA